MKLITAVAMLVCWLGLPGTSSAQTPPIPSRWAQPATDLSGQIADILGPGQAQLSLRNLSTIEESDVPAIRKLLEQDLKARGVLIGGGESANLIRITLSENIRERLWVAEIVEGSETRVAMVHLNLGAPVPTSATNERLLLRRQTILISSEPVLAALEIAGGLVVLEPEQIEVYSRTADGFRGQQRTNIEPVRQLARDPRGMLLGYAGGARFEAWIPGVQCSGTNLSATPNTSWSIQCRASDDPWGITQPPPEFTNFGEASGQGQSAQASVAVTPIQAFYNSARDYFTGVLAPSAGLDLRPFYELAVLPRPANQSALLVGSIDGRVQMMENGSLRAVSGTRDWGSDFAVIRSGCGMGAQVIATSSGEATTDSLRAFEISTVEAVPVSSPLAINGAVTAMWAAADGKSDFAVIRNAANQYEVDRVTALCN